jgi:hypothetical protein
MVASHIFFMNPSPNSLGSGGGNCRPLLVRPWLFPGRLTVNDQRALIELKTLFPVAHALTVLPRTPKVLPVTPPAKDPADSPIDVPVARAVTEAVLTWVDDREADGFPLGSEFRTIPLLAVFPAAEATTVFPATLTDEPETERTRSPEYVADAVDVTLASFHWPFSTAYTPKADPKSYPAEPLAGTGIAPYMAPADASNVFVAEFAEATDCVVFPVSPKDDWEAEAPATSAKAMSETLPVAVADTDPSMLLFCTFSTAAEAPRDAEPSSARVLDALLPLASAAVTLSLSITELSDTVVPLAAVAVRLAFTLPSAVAEATPDDACPLFTMWVAKALCIFPPKIADAIAPPTVSTLVPLTFEAFVASLDIDRADI